MSTTKHPYPACCYAEADAPLEKQLYAAYNRAGVLSQAGLNYAGKPCPVWEELPVNVQMKWRAVAGFLLGQGPADGFTPERPPPLPPTAHKGRVA